MNHDFNTLLRDMVAKAVDERIGNVTALGDAMARLHGEYVKPAQAAQLLNVSTATVRRMCADGRLRATDERDNANPLILVRSIAALTEEKKSKSTRFHVTA